MQGTKSASYSAATCLLQPRAASSFAVRRVQSDSTPTAGFVATHFDPKNRLLQHRKVRACAVLSCPYWESPSSSSSSSSSSDPLAYKAHAADLRFEACPSCDQDVGYTSKPHEAPNLRASMAYPMVTCKCRPTWSWCTSLTRQFPYHGTGRSLCRCLFKPYFCFSRAQPTLLSRDRMKSPFTCKAAPA